MPLRLPWREEEATRAVSRPADADEVLRLTPAVGATPETLCARLVASLATGTSGVAWVYDALAQLASAFALDDSVLVVDDDVLGRQVFRLDRRPVDGPWAEGILFRGAPGLHATPHEVPADTERVITELARLALRLDRLAHEASHDLLTGLVNRRTFDEVLGIAAAQARRYGWPFALVLIDLDGFKALNDRLGHQTGDACLRIVGTELRRGLRAGDTAARVGGDEFGLVLPAAERSDIEALCERLHSAIETALPAAGLGLSVGAALAPDESADAQELFGLADSRLYEMKRRDR